MRITYTISLLVAACAITAWGQAPSAPAKQSAAPAAKPAAGRTPDGHPDLQGNWLSNAATPFERPKELGDRTTLTDDEVVELNKRAKRIFAAENFSDAASADGYFMAAWNNIKRYKQAGATDSSERVTELYINKYTSLITDPADGKMPAMTKGGQERRAAYGRSRSGGNYQPEDIAHVAPSDRCITYAVPRVNGVYATGLHGYYQIVQTKDHVLLFAENVHESRIIYTDGRTHAPASVREWAGDSIGHWEGDTLVVDTTNFRAQLHPLGVSDKFHLTEKFTRVSADQIDYSMTFDDPETWTKQWTAVIRLKHTDDRLYETGCHEGNEAIMKTILSGNTQ